ncbi:hypothetical protein GOBAR_DD02327 [Gossypium barbadense]|nr:hypothetical protein GOBAR_DD02327 [Gossypium barbadense]
MLLALCIDRETVEDPKICVQALEDCFTGKGLWPVNGPRILQVEYEDPKVMEAKEQINSSFVHGSETEEPSTTTSK